MKKITAFLFFTLFFLVNGYSQTNEQKARALQEALATGDPVPLQDYVSADEYTQHNLGLPDGRDALAGFYSGQPIGITVDIHRSIEVGDYVMLHTTFGGSWGAISGTGSDQVVFDVWRFENGLMVEHWDNITNVTDDMDGTSQIDGAVTPATDLGNTMANQTLLEEMTQTLFVGGDWTNVGDYFDINNYVQHSVGAGTDGAFLASLQGQTGVSFYDEVKFVHTQGNFGLVMSQGPDITGQDPNGTYAYYDLFRMENGKIVEHWDIIQAIPPQNQWANNNGKWGDDAIQIPNGTDITLRNTLQDPGDSEVTYASLFGQADDAFDEEGTLADPGVEFATALAQGSTTTGLPFDINGLYEIDFTQTGVEFTLLPDDTDPFWIQQFGVFPAGKFDRYYFTFSEPHNITSAASNDASVNLRIDSETVIVVEIGEGYNFNPGVSFFLSFNMAEGLTNEQKARGFNEGLQTGDPSALKWMRNDYIQHNLTVPTGKAGVAFFYTGQPIGLTIDINRSFQAGDYVFAQTTFGGSWGAISGSGTDQIIYDVWRFENGMAVEHWDNIGDVIDDMDGTTQTDGVVTPVTDLGSTAANQALLEEMSQTLFVNGDWTNVADYFDLNNYVQHSVGAGADGAFLVSLQGQTGVPFYESVKFVHTQGNFGLVMSQGPDITGQDPDGTYAYYDLFRMENGKIVEHWDIIEEIPPQDQWVNNNGKWGDDAIIIPINEGVDITLRNTLEEGGVEATYASLFGAADDAYDEFAVLSNSEIEFSTALAQGSATTGLPFDINGLYEIDFTENSIEFSLLPDGNDPFWIQQFGVFPAGKFDRYYFTFSEPHNISSFRSDNSSVNLRIDSDHVIVVELSEGYNFNPGMSFTIDLNPPPAIVVEVTLFDLNQGVDPATFQARDAEIEQDFASQQPGFLKRMSGVDANGQYVVMVFWETLADADASITAFGMDPTVADYFAMIDGSTFSAERYTTFAIPDIDFDLVENNVIEITTFNLNAGVDPDAFVNRDAEIEDEFASLQPGFIRRTSGVQPNDKYAVIVFWDALADADASIAAFGMDPSVADYFAMIDGSTFAADRYTIFGTPLNEGVDITLRNTLEEGGVEATYASLFGAADDAYDEFAVLSNSDIEFATALAQGSATTGLPFDINGLYEIDFTENSIEFSLLPDNTDPFWTNNFEVFPAGKIDRYYFTFSEPHNITSFSSTNNYVNLRIDSEHVVVVEINEGYDFNPGISFTINLNPNNSGVDLDLAISASDPLFEQYTTVDYTVTLQNTGSETATNVVVHAGIPEGMVYGGNTNTSSGDYNLFFEEWTLPSLASGETAELQLTLFNLDNVDITNFVEVISLDQDDLDSSPNNGNVLNPQEDDEAVVTVSPLNPNPPTGGTESDLSLSISTDSDTYEQYTPITYTVTIINDGPDDAAGIDVAVGLPTGTVYGGSATTTNGEYNLFFEEWNIELLASGEMAILELTLFTLTDTEISNFVEIIASNQDDPDSTPNNGNGISPQEDDESVITIQNAESNSSRRLLNSQTQQNNYSRLDINSTSEQDMFTATTRVTLSPNPFNQFTNFEIHSPSGGKYLLQVFDISGKEMTRQTIELIEGINRLPFDASHLSNGFYNYRFSNSQGFVSGKMIVVE